MSNSLPPGWTGNDSHHRIEIAGLWLVVAKWTANSRERRPYHWHVKKGRIGASDTVLICNDAGHETAAQARADGIAAVEAFARKLLEETAKLREVPNE